MTYAKEYDLDKDGRIDNDDAHLFDFPRLMVDGKKVAFEVLYPDPKDALAQFRKLLRKRTVQDWHAEPSHKGMLSCATAYFTSDLSLVGRVGKHGVRF